MRCFVACLLIRGLRAEYPSLLIRFVEVRMVEAKPGIAFVEFESELQSGVALSGLAGFQITPTHTMQVTYAKQ